MWLFKQVHAITVIYSFKIAYKGTIKIQVAKTYDLLLLLVTNVEVLQD